MPKYSRRHYEDVAKIMSDSIKSLTREIYPEFEAEQRHSVNMMILRFVDMFEADNPQFDRDRFFKACGFRF